MHSFISIFILTVLTTAVVVKGYVGDEVSKTTGCPMRFSEKCHCGYGLHRNWFPDREVFITNCTNTGFTDASVLEYVPVQTEVLIFMGNHFPTLPWNVLGIWNDFENLTVIDLTNNGIKEIPGKAFHKVSNVKRLILNHNDIYIVSDLSHPRVFSNFIHLEELHLTNAFTEQVVSQWYLLNLQEIFISSNLNKLKKLHLEQNEIWRITNPDIFCPLTSLRDLHLSDNQLTDINFSISCLKNLRYLALDYNKITNLNNNTLNVIESVFGNPKSGRSLNLKGNPFRCDCYMQNLYNWQLHTNVTFANKEELRCYDGYPLTNAGIKFDNIRQLDCENEPIHFTSANSSHAVASTLLAILIALTATLILVLLWINRMRVRERFSPMLENFKSSFQYSTIDKDEELPPEVNV